MTPDILRYLPYAMIALVLVVVVLRVRRMMNEVRWSPVRMWIVAGIFVALTAAIAVADRITRPSDVAIVLAAFAVGGVLGWVQGMHTAVRVDRASHAMFVTMSPIAASIFLAVLVLRFAIRGVSGGFDPTASVHAGTAGVVGVVSVALLALIAGMSVGVRIYLQRVYSQAA